MLDTVRHRRRPLCAQSDPAERARHYAEVTERYLDARPQIYLYNFS